MNCTTKASAASVANLAPDRSLLTSTSVKAAGGGSQLKKRNVDCTLKRSSDSIAIPFGNYY